MKLSIIIPVYNSEQYLRKCLGSCLNQDIPYSEYELIVIDDGSTDRSLDILNEYASRYPNISILSQENQRQGMARNSGLKIAQGDYIWFVDSDDYIEENCLGGLFQKEDRTADVVLFPKCFIVGKNKVVEEKSFLMPDSVENIPKGTLCFASMPPTCWAYLYKHAFLLAHDFRFIKDIWEDTEFSAKIFYHVREIETYSKPLYYYRKNESSETGNISAQKCNGFYEMACIISKLKSDLSPLTEEWDIFYTRSIVELLDTFLCHIQFVLTEERDTMISKLKNNNILLYEFKRQGRIKSRIKVWLIKHATWLLFLYFRIIRRITRSA